MSRWHIYVDESGDRIWGSYTSPVYALSAVIVRQEDRGEVEEALGDIRAALRKPAGTVLSWSGNLRRPAQRAAATARLAAAPLRLTNVVVLKEAMREADPSAPHPALLYCDALLRLLERALWFVGDRRGDAAVALARVEGISRAQLETVLDLGRSTRSKIQWGALRTIGIAEPREVPALQAAGIAAGCLAGAFSGSPIDDLARLAPIIDVRGRGNATRWGVVIVGPAEHVRSKHPWWPAIASLIERTQPPPRPRRPA